MRKKRGAMKPFVYDASLLSDDIVDLPPPPESLSYIGELDFKSQLNLGDFVGVSSKATKTKSGFIAYGRVVGIDSGFIPHKLILKRVSVAYFN